MRELDNFANLPLEEQEWIIQQRRKETLPENLGFKAGDEIILHRHCPNAPHLPIGAYGRVTTIRIGNPRPIEVEFNVEQYQIPHQPGLQELLETLNIAPDEVHPYTQTYTATFHPNDLRKIEALSIMKRPTQAQNSQN